MAIRKLDRSFAPTVKQLNYLSKSFDQWRQSFIDYAKVYFPNTYNDFNEASPGMMFIEMASYLGDVLSYYMDTQFRENLMLYAEEPDNIIAISQAMGYKPKPTSAASCDIDLYQLCPAGTAAQNYAPDTRFMLRLASNTVVSSTEFGQVSFRTVGETNFADPTDREITVYSINAQNQPLTYLMRKRVRAVAGEIKTTTVSVGTPDKFTTIALDDNNILEVLSLKDSAGFTWSEVDYLAQDLIIEPDTSTTPARIAGQSVPPTYLMRVRRTPRRFVTRYNSDFKLELHFGSGIFDDTDATINLEPNKIANDEYQTNLASTSLDPSDFLSSQSYGLAPGNIDFTIIYAVGGGLESNVPSNSINRLSTVTVLNDRSGLSASERSLFEDIIGSLAVNNMLPATGGKDADSVEEIRQNALAFFNAQNRAVNAKDYTVRSFAMPAKFGSIAKAFVAQDQQINNIVNIATDALGGSNTFVEDLAGVNTINLYVLGYDNNKKLITLNQDIKKNLRTYLDQYRILTDEVRILDAFVVNIGVNFRVVVFKNFNMSEVLARCIDAIKNFFTVDKWQINQPIILADLTTELASVEGVQSITNIEVVNKYRFLHGADYNEFIYDIAWATENGIIYPSLDPCIFELRYPENDIVGSATQ
jgi:hypothetical protein